MISFWVNAAGSFTIEQYLALRIPDFADRIQVRTYQSLQPELQVSGGAHIFSALDQLSAGGRDMVSALYDRLSELRPADRLLNNPRRVWQRYELLTKLFEAGINSFRAYRAAATEPARFPVFVREESGHGGPLTRLLGSRRELAKALLALRARGFRTADLLVIEFCDLKGSDGLVRSASAYKIGEHIVPAFQLSGRHWMLKWGASDHDERAMREFVDYVTSNPHEAWLRRIFALAGVDYGRIDYGVLGETLQAWEINLNPTLGPGRGPKALPLAPQVEAIQQQGRSLYHNAMRKAFRALDPQLEQTRVTVGLDPAVITRMRAESARTERRRAAVRFLEGIYHHPTIGRVFRAVYSGLLPHP